ncbi:MAG: hypothetical protein ACLRRK_01325 [Parasutterella sp.]
MLKTLDHGPQGFQGKADMIENPGNVQQEEPRARTRAPIGSDIGY